MTMRRPYRWTIGVEIHHPDGWRPAVAANATAQTRMDLHWRRTDSTWALANLAWTVTRRRMLLTPRETQILQLIAEGYIAHQIASELFISEKTVRTHIVNLKNRLQASSLAHAVMLGIRAELIPLDPAHPDQIVSAPAKLARRVGVAS